MTVPARLVALLKVRPPAEAEERVIAVYRVVLTGLAFVAAIVLDERQVLPSPALGQFVSLAAAAVGVAAVWFTGIFTRRPARGWPECVGAIGDHVLLGIAAAVLGLGAAGMPLVASVRAGLSGLQFGVAGWLGGWLIFGATFAIGGDPELDLFTGMSLLLAIIISILLARIGRSLLASISDEERGREQQRELMGILGHELRNPLHVIISASQVIDKHAVDPKTRQLLVSIEASARSLEELVAEALAASSVREGGVRLAPTPFALHHLVGRVRDSLASAAVRGAVKVEWSVNESVPVLRGSKRHIEQVLTNLASNAIKYTPPGGVVRISIHHYFESPTNPSRVTLVFSVADTGRGIPAEVKARLFQPFTQSSQAAARRYDSTGLGLYIIRTLSDAMGGHLDVADNQGGGTIFTWQITLDVERGASGEGLDEGDSGRPVQMAAAEHKQTTRAMRCLVVDDNLHNRMVTGTFLTKAGHRVRECGGGGEAIELIREGGIDIVFLDLHMQDMLGWDVLRAIGESPGWANAPPIVMVSGAWDPDTANQARELGAADYLQKPIAVKELLRVVRRHAQSIDAKAAAASARTH